MVLQPSATRRSGRVGVASNMLMRQRPGRPPYREAATQRAGPPMVNSDFLARIPGERGLLHHLLNNVLGIRVSRAAHNA